MERFSHWSKNEGRLFSNALAECNFLGKKLPTGKLAGFIDVS